MAQIKLNDVDVSALTSDEARQRTLAPEEGQLHRSGPSAGVLDETPFFLNPTSERIIVEEDDYAPPSRIIHIPDKYQVKGTTGRVVAVGEYSKGLFKIGDRLLWGQFSGTQCGFRNRKVVRILRAEEVLAWVNSEDKLETTDA